ncbi:MAG: acylphosphatase [Clostridia bacterium]|nr:acylphosphatase [Clostridia bacterium]
MNHESEILRKRICFYGRVQAVGFRFQAQQAARKNGVTGWVHNEYDGSVTMEIQGTERQINEVVAEIDRDPYIRIERLETKWLETNPDEKNFRIKRGF